MPNMNFPGPKYNQVIENDPQIKQVPLEKMDWAARKSAMPTDVKNDQVIKHVDSK